MLYPLQGTATTTQVLTRIDRQQRCPFPMTLFRSYKKQPYIHSCNVTITGVHGSFLVFFNKHKRLAINEALDVPLRGEVFLMKLGKRGFPVHLRSRQDAAMARWLAHRYVYRVLNELTTSDNAYRFAKRILAHKRGAYRKSTQFHFAPYVSRPSSRYSFRAL